MSTKLGTAYIEVKGDFSKFDRDVEQATGKGSGKFAAFGKAAAAGIAVGGVAMGAFAVKAIGAASDVNESLSKNQVLFGKYSKGVEAFANTSARSYGISKRAALEYTGVFGNLFRALGENEKASAKQSVSLTKLAADMASFNNTSVEDALEAIRSGLVGETEPLRKFGVNMNDATLRAQALKMGLIDSTKQALDPHTKALAASALIAQQTSKAHGDFQRTSSGLANQSRILKARLDDASASIGQKLLPFAVKSANALNDMLDAASKGTGVFGWLRDAVGRVKDAFSGAGSSAGTFTKILSSITNVATAAADIARVLWQRFGGIITDELLNKLHMFQGVIEGAVTVLGGLSDFLAGVFTGDWSRAWDGIQAIFDGVWQAFTTIVTSTWETVKNITRLALVALVAVIKGLGQPFIDAGKWIVNRLVEGIKAYADAWISVAGWIKNRLVDGLNAAKDGFVGAGRWITNRLGDGIKTITDVFGGVGGWIKNRVSDFIQNEITGFKLIGSWITNRLAEGVRTVTDLLSGVGGWFKNRLVDAFDSVKDGITGIGGKVMDWIVGGARAGVNKLVGFLNDIIKLINKLPGVNIGLIARVSSSDTGDGGIAVDQALATGGQIRRGTKVNRPTILMGEEAPRHPEYVIPTNPAYRGRALGLAGQLLSDLGVKAFAQGGVIGSIAKRVWSAQTDLMGSHGAMPPLVYSKLAEGVYAHFNAQNGKVAIGPDMLSALRNERSRDHDYALSSLVHEFAHARQRASVIMGDRRALEGGAEQFALWADNRIFSKLGVPFTNSPNGYPSETAWVRKNKSEAWWKRGQFSPDAAASAADVAAKPGPAASAASIFDTITSIPGKLAGAISDLLGPLPSVDVLPDWLKGLGKFVLGRAGSFIKDKAGSLFGLGIHGSDLKGDGLARVKRMVDRMDDINAKGWPYVYGGGHGSFAGPYDCSGLVSAVLNAGGFLGSPVTTDGLKVFGEGGDGKVITIGVRGSSGRNAHTMMKLGNRYLESGSGHGARWVGGWSGNFPIHRHPAGFAKGGVFSDAILNPADPWFAGWGLAKGGVVGGPFVGSYKTGGIVPRDGLAYVHQGETITPAGEPPDIRIWIGDTEIKDIVRVEFDERDRRAVGTYRAGALA